MNLRSSGSLCTSFNEGPSRKYLNQAPCKSVSSRFCSRRYHFMDISPWTGGHKTGNPSRIEIFFLVFILSGVFHALKKTSSMTSAQPASSNVLWGSAASSVIGAFTAKIEEQKRKSKKGVGARRRKKPEEHGREPKQRKGRDYVKHLQPRINLAGFA